MSGIFSFGQNNDSVMHGEFMGFVIDDDSLVTLRSWGEKQGFPHATTQQGGPDMFAQMLESSSPPKTAVVDIDGQSDPVAITTRLISLCGGDCRLIIAGSVNDIAFYQRIKNAGAIEYLVKPLSSEMLSQALATALRGPTPIGGKPNAKEAHIVAFIGTRGGVGATTIALNVGWLLAHEMSRSAVLLDLDLQFGSSALALDLEPGRGLRDIVSSPNRVDGLMIASSIVPESENFSVLGAEEAVDEVVPTDGSAITALLKEMKGNFDVILIDLPRYMLAAHKRVLMAAHEIVLVSDMTLPGIRDTLRIKSALISLGTTARVTIVGSRTNEKGAGHIDRGVFEKGIQGHMDALVPEDTVALAAASNSGKALGASAPRAVVTKAMRDLALRVGNIDEAALVKPSFWAKLGGKKKRNKDGKRSPL